MKVLAVNRKAKHDYKIIKKELAGIKLKGHEVKSVKTGHITLKGAYVVFYKGEPYLVGAHIPLYQHANSISRSGYDPERMRKLLMTKQQIERWKTLRKTQKLVVVPLKIVLKNGLIKVEVGLARPLRKPDKRKKSKERAEKRQAERESKMFRASASVVN